MVCSPPLFLPSPARSDIRGIPWLTNSADNKVLIVALGGLAPLIRQMVSPNVEVQCNAVGCITNLATHEENKAKIARSGALGPLIRLAKSKDMRVQRNATGALLNMTHSGIFPPSLSVHQFILIHALIFGANKQKNR